MAFDQISQDAAASAVCLAVNKRTEWSLMGQVKKGWKLPVACSLIGLLTACTSTKIDETFEVGERPLCSPGRDFGQVAVHFHTQWRSDQKEPAQRENMALVAIENVFSDFPCGRVVKIVQIEPAPLR
jgi:hypothetical protein